MSAEYLLNIKGEVKGTSGTHADDILYFLDDGAGGRSATKRIKKHSILSQECECNLTFCGHEVRQAVLHGYFSVRDTREATIQEVNVRQFEGDQTRVRKTAHERLTATQQEHLKSVTGSLQRVVRIMRKESQTAVSMLQQKKKQATVAMTWLAQKIVCLVGTCILDRRHRLTSR